MDGVALVLTADEVEITPDRLLVGKLQAGLGTVADCIGADDADVVVTAAERDVVGQIAAVGDVGLNAVHRDFGLMVFNGAAYDVVDETTDGDRAGYVQVN